MKFLLLISAIIFSTLNFSFSQVIQNDNYQFSVDLTKVENDQLEIELITPVITENTSVYKLPAMIPGTYKIYDFGRYVTDFKAYDNSGNELNVTKSDVNSWEISEADRLYKINYKINDSFDDTTGVYVFEPAGTSIEEGKVFVVNNNGFFGYFSDKQKNPYTISFTKPAGFFRSTSLESIQRTDSQEIFKSPDYQFLIDNPVLFCPPDTATINFEEASILISVYSPGKGITAEAIAVSLNEVLKAIRNYLGGKLTADKYAFLYYFTDKSGSGSFGALEHNNSSFYFMPDVPKQNASYMINQLMSTSAHEFYHTVTPLNLHSEEIGNFDFNDPKMSKHLWLYEGVTEYNANYIMLREGLIDFKEYVKIIGEKISSSSNFNDTLPFTVMSKGALDEFESQYINVYSKGALIGLCLDILIREGSGGSMGLQDVINKLLLKYGKENSFKDEDLFNEITEMTSPEVGSFIKKYIDGYESIPYADYFTKIGIAVKKTPYQKISMGGGIQLGFNQKNYRLVVNGVETDKSKFLSDLGLKKGDEFVSINGTKLSFFNFKDAFGSVKNQIKEGDKFEMEVARTDASGNEKIVKLSAIIPQTKTLYEFDLSVEKNLNEQQKKLKTAWLGRDN